MLLRLLVFYISIQFSFAQDWNFLNSTNPIPDLPIQNQFGFSVSVEGNVAVVGAPMDDELNQNAGKAYVYEKQNDKWRLVSQLYLEGYNEPEAQFGKTVLIKDDLILVGAPNFNGFGTKEEGIVRVFKRNSQGWQWVNELRLGAHIQFAHFGSSIAYHNGIAVIGAPGSNNQTENSGLVLLFKNIEIESFSYTSLGAPESELNFKFGNSVALNDENLFIGDTRTFINNLPRGSVFIYDLETLTLKGRITTNDNVFRFGNSLTLFENDLAIGAWGDNGDNTFGTVYLYTKPINGWTNITSEKRKLKPNNADYGFYGNTIHIDQNNLIIGSANVVDFYKRLGQSWNELSEPFRLKNKPINGSVNSYSFGTTLGISGNDVLVGSNNYNVLNKYSGATFIFEKMNDDWSSIISKDTLSGISTSASGDNYGHSIDLYGKYAVVGAPEDDTNGESSGAAYVIKFNGKTWDRIAKLTPSDGDKGHYFGHAVAIHNNTIAISSTGADLTFTNGLSNAGKVYIFEKPVDEWKNSTETSFINKETSKAEGQFGYDLDINGDELIISYFRPGASQEIGDVYLYKRNGPQWIKQAQLRPTSNSFRQFGAKVALSESLALISAPVSEIFDGSVLLYEKPSTGWTNTTQKAVLRPSNGRSGSSFESSIAIFENTILIGSRQGYTGGYGAGYIFEKKSAWTNATEDAILTPNSIIENSLFGSDVALGRDFAAIASTSINSNSGMVLFFRKTDGEWKNSKDYAQISTDRPGDFFGASLAINEDFIAIGSKGANSSTGGKTGIANFYIKQPTVNKVTSENQDGVYRIGDKINIKVIFSQPIVVSGTPILELALDENRIRNINLISATNSQELNFEYTVIENDSTDNLDYVNSNSLKLGQALVKSNINEAYALTSLPTPGTLYSLSGNKNIIVKGAKEKEIVTSTEMQIDNKSIIYPNPFNNEVTVNLNSKEKIKVTLVNLNGEIIFDKEISSSFLKLPEIQNGVYIIELKQRNGKVYRQKVIKL